MTEPISKSDLRANENSTVELIKIPLIGSAYDVVVVKYPLWRTDAEGKCIPEISRVCATCKPKYRLLEIGLRSQLERSEKIGIVGFRASGNAASGCFKIGGGWSGNGIRGSA